jgi:hypothetical protein
VPRRTFWLVAGVAVGTGSTLWAERKVRQTWEQAAARLQPDAIVVEVGRSARQVAGSAGGRLREALTSGRSEMLRREEELWAELASQAGVESEFPIARNPTGRLSMSGRPTPAASLPSSVSLPSPSSSAPARVALPRRPSTALRASLTRPLMRARLRPRREKSPSYLGN